MHHFETIKENERGSVDKYNVRKQWLLSRNAHLTSPSVQSSMMIQTGFSVMTPISFTMWGWSNWRMVTARKGITEVRGQQCEQKSMPRL